MNLESKFEYRRADTMTDVHSSDMENMIGLSLAKKGKFLDALKYFEKAVKFNPNNAKAWYNYGTCLTKLGKNDEISLKCFEKTIEINHLTQNHGITKALFLQSLAELKKL